MSSNTGITIPQMRQFAFNEFHTVNIQGSGIHKIIKIALPFKSDQNIEATVGVALAGTTAPVSDGSFLIRVDSFAPRWDHTNDTAYLDIDIVGSGLGTSDGSSIPTLTSVIVFGVVQGRL